MTSRRAPANSGGSRARCPSPAPDRLSRCSSNASSEVASVEEPRPPQRSGDPEVDDELETLPCHFECSREGGETTPSSELRVESGDLESTAGKRKSRRTATEMAEAVVMPPVAEIEEFFAAAERANSENLRLFGRK
ncbi:putative cyclin-dependent kinase inhibitor 1 [Cocos nucifera]|uniref:Putative cyclin-dependent kinase inhibitor 1 n=1 Tax=Cocos nucifera TaxID=13894 RepID=A0A8K0IT47_COCNU|nr:putative cyclin-dependent kinase inhibitor 1 [Cocos nucifera]